MARLVVILSDDEIEALKDLAEKNGVMNNNRPAPASLAAQELRKYIRREQQQSNK